MRKNLKLSMLSLVMLLFFACSANSNGRKTQITFEQLPEKAQTFMTTYFPNVAMDYMTQEKDGFDVDYEVRLVDGTVAEFNKKGDWKEVKGVDLPIGFLPLETQNYVKANHSERKVVKVERDKRTIEVEMSNELELKFNKAGDFIRLD